MSQLREILVEELTRRKGINPSYSQRAFASALGLNSGALSQILSGRRKVGKKVLQKLLSKIEVDPAQKNQVLEEFGFVMKAAQTQLRELSLEQFKMISEWEHYAILSLIELEDFHPNAAYISQKLGISQSLAKTTFQRLIDLGFIEMTQKGARRVSPSLITTNDLASTAIQKSHRDGLRQASQALDNISVLNREFASLCFAYSERDFPELKDKCRAFIKDILQITRHSKTAKDQVYKLSLQCFPITQKEGEKV